MDRVTRCRQRLVVVADRTYRRAAGKARNVVIANRLQSEGGFLNGAVWVLDQILELKGPHTQVVATKGTCSRNRAADSFDAAVMNALDVDATLPRLRAEERPEWG